MATSVLDRKNQKVITKQKRIQLMDRQTELAELNCTKCANETCNDCPISNELQDIGRRLLELSNEAYEAPAELTWSTYLLLKEREWENRKIAKHYEISVNNLNEFIKLNKNPDLYLKEEKTMVAQQKEQVIALTVERYLELKKEKKSDSAIRKQFGMKVHDFNKFKNKHDLINKKDDAKENSVYAKSDNHITISPIVPETVLQEPAAPKVNPLDEVVAELKEKLSNLTSQNELLEKESAGLANECNENYQNYIVADSKYKSLLTEMETMKEEYYKEINRMNGLLEESYKDDQYLTQTLERLVIARKTNTDLSN